MIRSTQVIKYSLQFIICFHGCLRYNYNTANLPTIKLITVACSMNPEVFLVISLQNNMLRLPGYQSMRYFLIVYSLFEIVTLSCGYRPQHKKPLIFVACKNAARNNENSSKDELVNLHSKQVSYLHKKTKLLAKQTIQDARWYVTVIAPSIHL